MRLLLVGIGLVLLYIIIVLLKGVYDVYYRKVIDTGFEHALSDNVVTWRRRYSSYWFEVTRIIFGEGLIVMLICVMFSFFLPAREWEYKVYKSTPIHSISDNFGSVSDFMGNGNMISSYYYYTKNDENQFVLKSIGSYTPIEYSDGQPRIDYYESKVTEKNPWSFNIFPDKRKAIIKIPHNSVKNKYILDGN